MRPFQFPNGRITRDAYKAMRLQLDPDDDEAERAVRMVVEKRNAKELRKVLDRTNSNFREYLPENMEADYGGYMADIDRITSMTRRDMEDALQRMLLESADLGVSVAVDQFENIGFGFDWTLANQHAEEWAISNSASLVNEIDQTTTRAIRQSVSRWVNNGEPLESLVSDLTNHMAFSRNRAELIASTETTRAYAEGNRIAYRESGVVDKVEWRTANDEKVCPICGPLDGERDVLDGDFGGVGYPPAHPRCILPGNMVTVPGRIIAATKSFYDGPAIEITVGSGSKITVTENHPILTGRGWVDAKSLTESDYVFSSKRAEGIASVINPDNDNMPALIEDIFASVRMSSAMSTVSVPSAAEDFNGDGKGIKGNIDIVWADGFLAGEPNVESAKHISEPAFVVGDMASGFNSDGVPTFLIEVDGATTSSIMRGDDLGVALESSHAIPFGGFGFGLCPQCRTMTFEKSSESTTTDSGLAAEFVNRFAGLITVDPIVGIREFGYSDHVYDLQVDPYELYFTGDIITHNCRCWIAPVVETRAERERNQ